MENFEITNITQIWEVFFFPIINVASVFLFIYFLLGKQSICKMYQKYKLVRIDNKYYRQKHIKIKKEYTNIKKEESSIFLPLSQMSEKVIIGAQNPIVLVIFFLLFVYALYKAIILCSSLYPIKYSICGSSMLLYSTPKHTVAKIWTYFPEYSLESLYRKISILGEGSSYAKYADYRAIYMFGNISKFCSILCILRLFSNKPKFKIYLKTLFLLVICFFAIVLSFYFHFQKDTKVLEQKAYYVEQQLLLEDPSIPTDFYKFQSAIGKVENELQYCEHKIFYGSFGIDFVLIDWYLKLMHF